MTERDLAREMKAASFEAARQSRANRRGVVDTVREDGKAVVILSSGHKVLRGSSGIHAPSSGESILMNRVGGLEEIFTRSAYGGGTGSAYAEP